MDFSKVTAIQIPEGNVTKIEDKDGRLLWFKNESTKWYTIMDN